MISKFVTGDVTWRGGIFGDVTGAADLIGLLTSLVAALPDLRTVEQDVIAENDLLVARLVVTGTHTGNPLNVPATGKTIAWDAGDVYRIRNGRISEERAADDIVAVMAQVGAFSPPWLG